MVEENEEKENAQLLNGYKNAVKIRTQKGEEENNSFCTMMTKPMIEKRQLFCFIFGNAFINYFPFLLAAYLFRILLLM